jgi:hypothetical protein
MTFDDVGQDRPKWVSRCQNLETDMASDKSCEARSATYSSGRHDGTADHAEEDKWFVNHWVGGSSPSRGSSIFSKRGVFLALFVVLFRGCVYIMQLIHSCKFPRRD